MFCRGIRGAITVTENSAAAISAATHTLLLAIIEANHLNADTIASVIFTATPDLNAAYPAPTARTLPGWHDVPLACMQEMVVHNSLPRCLRVLILWNTELSAKDIQHVYLEGARNLRPDLTKK